MHQCYVTASPDPLKAALAGWVQTAGSYGRALALDIPGCGVKQGRQTSTLTMRDVAIELIADIEHAGLKDIVLVGHSQGGQALAYMATIRPDLISNAVFVTCSAPVPGQSVMQMMGTSKSGCNPDEVGWPFDPLDGKPVDHFRTMFCNDMLPKTADAFLAKLDGDQWPTATYSESEWDYQALQAIPSSYIVCLADLALSVAWQRVFARRFGATRMVDIDAGHQPMISRPHALAEALRIEVEWLDQGDKPCLNAQVRPGLPT